MWWYPPPIQPGPCAYAMAPNAIRVNTVNPINAFFMLLPPLSVLLVLRVQEIYEAIMKKC
jgi:hypothetical protein